MENIIKIDRVNYLELIKFTIPITMGFILAPIAGVVDTAFVGRLSTQWLGALAFCVIIINSSTWIFNFIVHVTTQMIADCDLKTQSDLLIGRIKICLFTGLGLGLFGSILLGFFRYPLFSLAGASPELFLLMDQYYIAMVLGYPFMVLYITFLSILRGLGRVRESFFIMALTTLCNIFLTWVMLYVFDEGLKGVAYGTVLSNFVGCLVTAGLVVKYTGLRNYFKVSSGAGDQWFRFGENSFNLFIRSAVLTVCFFISIRFAGKIGIETLVAHQILLQVWLFMSFFPRWFSFYWDNLSRPFYISK